MIVPSRRTRSSSFSAQRKKLILRVAAALIMSGLAVAIFVLSRSLPGTTIFGFGTDRKNEQKTLMALWKEKRYDEIVKDTDELLKNQAMNGQALVFGGFAYFYTGTSQAAAEDKLPFFDQAIKRLRKALLVPDAPYKAETDYILGKSYYHKGAYFYDQSIKYLRSAESKGYKADDINEYLGLSYAGTGEYRESEKRFLLALENHPSDLLQLTLAQTYLQMDEPENAELYLNKCARESKEPALVQKAHAMLGAMKMQRKDYAAAEDHFRMVVKYNEASVEAHFNLGEIYFFLGDMARARAEWRKTLKYDPKHLGALKRLYK
jgi:tetratricopeptide (TPR) repeat protein